MEGDQTQVEALALTVGFQIQADHLFHALLCAPDSLLAPHNVQGVACLFWHPEAEVDLPLS